jgi:hypothetical protein
VKGKLFPSVGMKKSGEHIRVNFGQSPFVFDIDGIMSVSSALFPATLDFVLATATRFPYLIRTDVVSHHIAPAIFKYQRQSETAKVRRRARII